ncbi:hypothetical protein BN2475_40133 [Paraburkholderia ribeironis]|uniref:Uncharacterized protein n=1 Tax=Paraburkholderia ribeironis TaxID=1247936 RepID=A0A1N7RJQ5_9BURK|nr:hypothetical protein BN2475_40133 [Paraburkholderia ribeironis]
MPSVSFKTSKIIRYHYAFDPNPDRLTQAFLNNSKKVRSEFSALALQRPPVDSLAASSPVALLSPG